MSWLDRVFVLALPWVPRPIMRRLSRRYIAGEERAAALDLGSQLAGAGYRITYDLLGESVTDRSDVARAAGEYRELIRELIQRGQELNVSVKPTLMGLLIDEELCYREMEILVEEAQASGGFVRFEMEDSSTTDGTLRVFHRLRERFGDTVGCVLQSMLLRTPADAEALLAVDAPLNVRLVKGIYVEPPLIAHQDDPAISAAYLATLEVLLSGGASVAVATHDEKLVAGLEALVDAHPAWAERCELQLLLGVREEVRQEWKHRGHPVRVYVPYGSSWLPYVLRRLKGNPKLARYAFLGLFGKREQLADL